MFEVVLQLFLAGNTDEDSVVATLVGELELRMVHEPAEGDLDEREVVLFDDGFDDLERVESGVLEVSLSAPSKPDRSQLMSS